MAGQPGLNSRRRCNLRPMGRDSIINATPDRTPEERERIAEAFYFGAAFRTHSNVFELRLHGMPGNAPRDLVL